MLARRVAAGALRSARSTTRRFASKEPHPASKHSIGELNGPIPLRYRAWAAFESLAGPILLLSAAATAGAMYVRATRKVLLDEVARAVAEDVAEVFARGHVPAEACEVVARVARPALHKKLAAELRPADRMYSYVIVAGEPGRGKSTALRQVARECPADGPNGVVYCSAADPAAFSMDLARVLGLTWGERTLEKAVAWRRLLLPPQGDAHAPPASFEPSYTWRKLADILSYAASAFWRKHKRDVTLIVGDADSLLRAQPEFFSRLECFAKRAILHGHLRVVFVASDVGTLEALDIGRVERVARVVKVGDADVPDEEAVAHLTERLGWTSPAQLETAKYIVEHITGALQPHAAGAAGLDPRDRLDVGAGAACRDRGGAGGAGHQRRAPAHRVCTERLRQPARTQAACVRAAAPPVRPQREGRAERAAGAVPRPRPRRRPGRKRAVPVTDGLQVRFAPRGEGIPSPPAAPAGS